MDFLYKFINILLDLIVLLIVLRAILSWLVHDRRSALMRFLVDATEPIISPIRRALPRTGMIDFSPLIALLLVQLIKNLVNSLF